MQEAQDVLAGIRVGDSSSILMETSLSDSGSSQVFSQGRQCGSTQDTLLSTSTLDMDRKKRPRLVNSSLDSGVFSTSSPDNTLPRRRKEVTRRNSHELQKSNSSTSVESQAALRPTHASLFSRRLSKLSTGLHRNIQTINYLKHFSGHLYSQVLQPKFPKPLYFEVPQCHPSTLSGRQWLFHEMREHLSSHLPTNRGVILAGGPGVGKTACILAMVERSCFGSGKQSVIEGKHRIETSKFYLT